jgi:SagB-type dehydrogenase family enzyme
VSREVPGDQRAAIAEASYGQPAVRSAPVTLVISADVAITASRYGPRAERYVTLEAGHAAQNVLLTATALGLGAVPIGAFDDDAVRHVLGLSEDVTPLYLIPIGALP